MPPLNYIDCVLKVSDHDRSSFEFLGRGYSGVPRLALAVLSPRLEAAGLDAHAYGKELFDALLPPDDDVTAGYRLALSVARLRGERLRLRLQVDVNAPPDLHGLNWERLHDEKEMILLCRAPETPFSRLPQIGRERKELPEGRPKMLVVISSPENSEQLGLDKFDSEAVRNEFRESLAPLAAATLDYEFLDGRATRERIREKLKEGFHALHIQGHGQIRGDRASSRLILEHEDGTADPLDEVFFAELLSGLPDLRLATLVVCHSGAHTGDAPFGGLAQALVRQNFPAVVAMQQPISFDGAKLFNRHFYLELSRHGLVDVAVNEARLYLHQSKREANDWSAPVLFIRLEDAKVWSPAAAPAGGPVVAVANEDDTFWEPILEALGQGQLIPIIGPDINHGLLPSHKVITDLWSKRYEYQRYNYPLNNRNDLPRVARFVEARNQSKFPHLRLLTLYKDELVERMKQEERALSRNRQLTDVIAAHAKDYFELDRDAPHRVLADLNISTYLTANPDNFMSEALKYRGRAPKRAMLLWQEGDIEPKASDEYRFLEGAPEAPLVWHLYGAAPRASTMVLTEDDHLDFLRFVSRDSWRLPPKLREQLTEATLLFLGFNMRDLDFRILFKGVISQLQARAGRVAVLQVQPDKSYEERREDVQLIQSFLEKDSTDLQIKLRWLNVRDFLIQLRERA